MGASGVVCATLCVRAPTSSSEVVGTGGMPPNNAAPAPLRHRQLATIVRRHRGSYFAAAPPPCHALFFPSCRVVCCAYESPRGIVVTAPVTAGGSAGKHTQAHSRRVIMTDAVRNHTTYYCCVFPRASVCGGAAGVHLRVINTTTPRCHHHRLLHHTTCTGTGTPTTPPWTASGRQRARE